ncbi:MAG: SMI1/KNR4 family protein [Polyangiaceae bacterium]|nr:SMI1/KNR4 family protein [Polyangiaceae bacterium]
MFLRYRPRFEQLLTVLGKHPEVEVFDAHIAPPAPLEALAEAEAFLGVPMPAAMREFYQEMNGFFVEWAPRGVEAPSHTGVFGFPDYGQPPGCINLLPVEEALSTSWQEDSHVNEIQEDHFEQLFGRPRTEEEAERLFDRGACCVDNFSKYNHGDLVLGPEPLMVVSTDHGADMEASDFLSFELYLELALSTWGLNRYSSIGIGWSRKPRRIDAWTERPSLDHIIERMREQASELTSTLPVSC